MTFCPRGQVVQFTCTCVSHIVIIVFEIFLLLFRVPKHFNDAVALKLFCCKFLPKIITNTTNLEFVISTPYLIFIAVLLNSLVFMRLFFKIRYFRRLENKSYMDFTGDTSICAVFIIPVFQMLTGN